MFETNPYLKHEMLEIVKTQLKNLDPPETKQTYDRLISSGISDKEARRLLGCAVANEIFYVLKDQQPFDRARFVEALDKLPELPEG